MGPVADTTVWTPYNETNAGSDTFCVKGGRKPAFGAGLARLDPSTWRAIWNEYTAFLQKSGTSSSVILLECYSMDTARKFKTSSSAYPFRDTVNFQVVALPWYSNSSFDSQALKFGSTIRDLWRKSNGLQRNST
jgi:hypothetical protein